MWNFISPFQAHADPGMIESFLYALEEVQSLHSIDVRGNQREQASLLAEYGLTAPLVRIILSGPAMEQEIAVGSPVVYGEGVYTYSSSREGQVLVVPDSMMAAIPDRPEAWRSRRLIQCEAPDINRLEIDSSRGYLLLQRKNRQEWSIVQPVDAPADRFFVMNYLQHAVDLSVDRFIADQVSDLSVYGINEPQLALTLWVDDAQRERISVGNRYAEGDGGVYVHADSSPGSVFGISLDAFEKLTASKELFRDRRLFSVEYDSIEAFELKTQKNTILFELIEGDWKMTLPVVTDADDEKVTSLVQQCLASEIKSFEPFQDLEKETNVTEIALAVFLKNQSASMTDTSGVDVVSSGLVTNRANVIVLDGAVYASILGGETKVELNAPFMEAFTDNPLDYRDLRLFDFSTSNVVEFSLYQGTNCLWKIGRTTHTEPFLVTRPENGWVRREQIQTLLDEVCNLKAESYVMSSTGDVGLFGLAPPLVTLTVGFSGGEGIRKSVLFGGRATGDRVYAAVRGSDVVFTLKQDLLDRLLKLVAGASPEQQDERGVHEIQSGK
jgi:hypothetical protein